MRIVGIETIRLDEYPNLLLLQVHTEDGIRGLGETFFGAQTVETYVHESLAPRLLGEDATHVERLTERMVGYVGYGSAGVETRAISAIDVALWDILGQATNRSITQLLGGPARTEIPVYNTCAGPSYVRRTGAIDPSNWGLGGGEGAYEDLDAFLNRPEDLAESLLAESINGMKIWPFDLAAQRTAGFDMSAHDLDLALAPVRRIREAVGMRMDLMIEMHGLWSVPIACRIARALEPYEPKWIEDPIAVSAFQSLGRVRRSTSIPVAAGETLGSSGSHRRLLNMGVVDVIIVDVAWVGGITEARKVADAASADRVEVSFHSCSGPVTMMASTHLALASPASRSQEIVRAFYHGWHQDLVVGLPSIDRGAIQLPPSPGLGIELQPDLFSRPGVHVRRTTDD